MTKEGRKRLFESDPKRFACYGAEFKEEKKELPATKKKPKVEGKKGAK